MDLDNLLGAGLILFVSALIAYFYYTQEITVVMCPSEAGYHFIGQERDYTDLTKSLPHMKNFKCEEHVMTKNEWFEIKRLLGQTYPSFPRPRGVR